jgi:hypothetical protein
MKFSPAKFPELEDLPNVGPRIAADFRKLGIKEPWQLDGRNPVLLYERLNKLTGKRHDPCVLDTFMAAVDFVNGAPARPWWKYTNRRKRLMKR